MERPRGWPAKLVLGVLGVALTCAAPSCASADDAVRILGQSLGDVENVAAHAPKGRLPGAVTATHQAVQVEINRMLAVLQGETSLPSAKQSAKAACLASDLRKVKTPEAALDLAMRETGTPAGRRSTVQALANDLATAETSSKQAEVLAGAAICQWAG